MRQGTCQNCRHMFVYMLRKCAGCGIHRYCGTECARLHWPYHREECQRIQRDRQRLELRDLETDAETVQLLQDVPEEPEEPEEQGTDTVDTVDHVVEGPLQAPAVQGAYITVRGPASAPIAEPSSAEELDEEPQEPQESEEPRLELLEGPEYPEYIPGTDIRVVHPVEEF